MIDSSTDQSVRAWCLCQSISSMDSYERTIQEDKGSIFDFFSFYSKDFDSKTLQDDETNQSEVTNHWITILDNQTSPYDNRKAPLLQDLTDDMKAASPGRVRECERSVRDRRKETYCSEENKEGNRWVENMRSRAEE